MGWMGWDGMDEMYLYVCMLADIYMCEEFLDQSSSSVNFAVPVSSPSCIGQSH